MKLLIILSLIGVSTFANMKEFEMTNGQFKLANGAGDTTVKGTDGSKVKVSFEKKKWDKKCSLDFKKTKGELKVTVKNDKSWFSSGGCEVDFTVELPRKINLDIGTGAGDAIVKDVIGNLTFKTGSGDLNVETSFVKNINGKLGSGDVVLKGSFKVVDIRTGSGDLMAAYSKLEKDSSLDVRTGSGDTMITLPSKSTTDVDFKSGVGQLKNKTMYGENPDLKISVKTGSGDLEVRY
jgi:DUF4097 and DUF4098 domain-containing protein YvlB